MSKFRVKGKNNSKYINGKAYHSGPVYDDGIESIEVHKYPSLEYVDKVDKPKPKKEEPKPKKNPLDLDGDGDVDKDDATIAGKVLHAFKKKKRSRRKSKEDKQ